MTDGSRCPEHAAAFEVQQAERVRDYDQQRDPFYQSAEWRRLRSACLAQYPTCAAPGCEARSAIAHHLVPREDGGPDTMGNLVGVCHRHHEAEHARLDAARTQRQSRPAIMQVRPAYTHSPVNIPRAPPNRNRL